jgi:uncharacterized protein (TIGR00299 family) protein
LHLLFDMQTGVAGDMILGALFDLGLDFGAWKDRMDGLGLPGRLRAERVDKGGVMATRFIAEFPEEHAHRGLSDIKAILAAAALPDPVKANAETVFTRLAVAEAAIHGTTPEQVHFHEVGALDAIVDVVGACLGFQMLGAEAFYTTPFTFGSGRVRTQHGMLAVPVPATLALTRGFPSVRTGLDGELCTPTGAAIVTAFAKPLPSGWKGVLRAHGYGAGNRDIPGMANVLRVCLMDAAEPAVADAAAAIQAGAAMPAYEVFQVECNLDNMSPEILGYAAERLFQAGALDAWQEPIHMKKNRSAVKLCALAEAGALDAVLGAIAAETSTGGIRFHPVRRLVAAKSFRKAATRFGEVELKEVTFPGLPPRLTPEFESCRALAQASGAPLQAIYREALARAAEIEAAPGAGREGAAP